MSLAARCVNGVGVCVLPTERNNFKPLALRHKPLAFVSTVLIVAKVVALVAVALIPQTADLSTITSARIAQLTNAERVKAGQSSLTVSAALTQAAQQKAQHMLAEDYFAHISPSGVTPWFWMSKVGYTYQVAGENLAIDFVEAEDVVTAWLASPSHRDNMLMDSYTETGVAVATGEFQGGTSTVVVHMFGLPSGASATVSKPSPTPAVKTSTTSAPRPLATPSPTATPTPVPSDTTAPRTPTIALTTAQTHVREHTTLTVTGEAGSTIHLLVNEQTAATVPLATDGTITHTLPLDRWPDGALTLKAYATDTAGNQSETTPPLLITKDTSGPRIDDDAIMFIISPATDQPAALVLAAVGSDTLEVTSGETTTTYTTDPPFMLPLTTTPTNLVLRDTAGNTGESVTLTLAPEFSSPNETDTITPPARFSRATRWLAALIFTIVLILVSLAILVRIEIQRPTLIGHASLVLLLALTIWLW